MKNIKFLSMGLMVLILPFSSCNDKEAFSINERASLETITNEELTVIEKLENLGITKENSERIIIEVVRPQQTLKTTYERNLMTTSTGGSDGLFKNGAYHAIGGAGPGESGGPINDICLKDPTLKNCRVKNAVHTIAPVEMEIFFPGGVSDINLIVNTDGRYDQSSRYLKYLTIIFND